MNQAQLLNYRLANLQLSQQDYTDAGSLLHHMGAMQGQDATGLWRSLALRLPGSSEQTVHDAIDRAEVIRTWALRGTLHLLPARAVSWMLDLLGPRILAAAAGREKQLELDENTMRHARKLIVKALQGKKALSRAQLYTLLEQKKISTDKQRGYHILTRMALEKIICLGSHRETQPFFVLLEEWAPPSQALPREEALAQLAGSYFSSHGPATVQDFSWWAGITLTDARAGLELVKNKLENVLCGEKEYWMKDPGKKSLNETSVFLLPGFDEYLLGYKDRSGALDPRYAQQIVPGNNGMFMPTIVIKGRVLGTWKRTIKKDCVYIDPLFFEPFDNSLKTKIEEASRHYGFYLGKKAELRFP